MDLRDYEPFHVFKSNTERMQQSPIIYMNKLLNTETKRKLDFLKIFQKNIYILLALSVHFCPFLDRCYYPRRSRDFVSPVCGIFIFR